MGAVNRKISRGLCEGAFELWSAHPRKPNQNRFSLNVPAALTGENPGNVEGMAQKVKCIHCFSPCQVRFQPRGREKLRPAQAGDDARGWRCMANRLFELPHSGAASPSLLTGCRSDIPAGAIEDGTARMRPTWNHDER